MAIAGTRIGKAARCAFRLDAASIHVWHPGIPSDPGASLLASTEQCHQGTTLPGAWPGLLRFPQRQL